jgi:hypothetical protein
MPSFTDVPSLDVGPSLHCNKKRWVKPLRVVRSIAFKAALVAQHVDTKQLTQLGGIDKTYNSKWQIDFKRDTDAYDLTETYTPDGTYPLSSSAAAVKLDGDIANTQGQAALNAEKASFEDRCEDDESATAEPAPSAEESSEPSPADAPAPTAAHRRRDRI